MRTRDCVASRSTEDSAVSENRRLWCSWKGLSGRVGPLDPMEEPATGELASELLDASCALRH